MDDVERSLPRPHLRHLAVPHQDGLDRVLSPVRGVQPDADFKGTVSRGPEGRSEERRVGKECRL